MGRLKTRALASPGSKHRWGSALNSPLAIAIISVGAFGGIAKLYADHQVAVADQTVRRGNMSNLLSEYRQRLSALEALDGELEKWLGEGPGITQRGRVSDDEQTRFEQKSLSVGQRQQDVIRGTGTYFPSTPAFTNVNLQTIASQIEGAAGIPNLQAGAIQLTGLLNADPAILWLFVRAYMPMMTQFYVGRHMLLINGQLPLIAGDRLSPQQEVALGIPQPKAGDLELIRRLNDQRFRELDSALRNVEISK